MQALLSFVLPAIALYCGFVLLVYVLQGRLLFLPNIGGRALDATPAAIGLDFADVRFSTRDGISLHGWFIASPDTESVLLFCHGNAGNISHRLDSIRIFHDLGLSVFIFDYRGYGLSDGRPSEEGTYRDAEAAWNYLVEERGVPSGRIVLFGRSLGAAIAAHLAQTTRPGALILESAFASVPDIAGHHYWFLPVRWLSRFEYATAAYVRDVHAPTLVIHSRDDEINPIEQGREVFRNANEPKAFLEISGDHNAGFLLSGARYTHGLDQFLREHAQGDRGGDRSAPR
jgi:pimeloyl-ACP methyl ester carboxylesterase